MATNIQPQSHTELKGYLEACLQEHFPAASNQEIANAIDVAMGRHGYALQHSAGQGHQNWNGGRQGQQGGRQDWNAQQGGRQDWNAQQGGDHQDWHAQQHQQSQQEWNAQQHQQEWNAQHGHLAHDDGSLGAMIASIAAVRDAAISAAQHLSDSSIRMAAIASAWVSYAATCSWAEQWHENEQKASRN